MNITRTAASAASTKIRRCTLTAGKRGAAFAGEPKVPAWVRAVARERG